MESSWLSTGLLLVGFVPLIYGADRLVRGGSDLARRFRVPSLVIGLTIVAFGTSAPELVVNLVAATSGETELALSNVVGSNIFNLLGILGLAAVVFPLKIAASTVRAEIPLMGLSALVLLVLGLDSFWADDPALPMVLGRADGLVLLLLFCVFLFYSFQLLQNTPDPTPQERQAPPWFVSAFWIVVGFGLLILGGKMIVEGATGLARAAGWSERIIGLTIVAVGTSLPELATSVMAAVRKETDIAVGNVVGSNIFNVFFILGLTAVFAPVPVPGPSSMDMAVNLTASALLFAFVFLGKGRRVSRAEGALFVGGYGAYVAVLLFA